MELREEEKKSQRLKSRVNLKEPKRMQNPEPRQFLHIQSTEQTINVCVCVRI